MKIELIPIDDLIPYANNARTHSEEQVLQIASSIKEFGFNAPILIDAKNGIIAGHGRVMAARKLKIEQAPCVRIEHLSEAQKKAYILADNKIGLNSGWDDSLLKIELDFLREQDFDMTLLGWNDLPDFDANPDYSILDAEDMGETLNDMAGGVKKAIQIEFEPQDYDEAFELVKFWRSQGLYVGQFLMQKLQQEKDKL
jgi:hypothetical protein